MDVREAEEHEVDALARIWYDGWNDAHAQIVPAELKRIRTLESFAERMRAALANVRVAGPPGAPVGFHMLKNDELYQLYVAAQSRGFGSGRGVDCRRRSSTRRCWSRNRLACVRDWKRSRREVLREEWLASNWKHDQPARNTGRSARSRGMAL